MQARGVKTKKFGIFCECESEPGFSLPAIDVNPHHIKKGTRHKSLVGECHILIKNLSSRDTDTRILRLLLCVCVAKVRRLESECSNKE